MARTDTAEGQALWQPGGAGEDSHFRERDRHLHLAYEDEEVKCGVKVSTSAFPDCHQCYCAGSGLAWGLNLRALVCGIF